MFLQRVQSFNENNFVNKIKVGGIKTSKVLKLLKINLGLNLYYGCGLKTTISMHLQTILDYILKVVLKFLYQIK